jgi:Tfx family DNA-binding protein
MTTREKSGSLTKIQLEVLRLRMTGLTQEEVATKLGTTRQNISLVERRARRNLEKAKETITAYRKLRTVATVTLPPTTHLVDVPRMLIDAADLAGVRISVDFSLIYKELKHDAKDSVSGTRITKQVRVDILSDGEVYIEPS